MKVEITVLGTGTSQGIPIIACDCEVCTSSDPKDNRLRTSVLFTVDGENFVIDTGPDFRQQMLRENIKSLRAVLFTHEHKDHTAGFDDVRAFNFKEKRNMEVYCSERVAKALKNEYHYIFSENKYPGIPKVNLNLIENGLFVLPNGVEVEPVEVYHYLLPVLGFKIGNFVYITDAKTVDKVEIEKIKNCEFLMINCLHEHEHISHFNLKEALAFIAEVNPKQAYLTHISHQFGKHKDILKLLPDNVSVAYDGLRFGCG